MHAVAWLPKEKTQNGLLRNAWGEKRREKTQDYLV